MKKTPILWIISLIVIYTFFLSGCGAKALSSSPPVTKDTSTEKAVNSAPISVKTSLLEPAPPVHHQLPGDISGSGQVILDDVSEENAALNQASAGDKFDDGLFERPFDQRMGYLGNLDIVKAEMVRNDPDFVYVSIQVANPVSAAINNRAYYGLELDPNRDGRNVYMIRGVGPLTDIWTTEGVDVWKSTSAEQPNIVAGEGVIPVTGSLGFDVNLMKAGRGSDNDLAWIRLKPGFDDTVEIAFKNKIIGGDQGKFSWRPFTDGAVFSEKAYDLQVSYTLEQAGSPYKDEPDYPLKDVFAVDNTCRMASGYEPTGNEPGLCPQTLPGTAPQ
jgi:hypothetical protein